MTICTKDRECILGETASSKMILNEMGKVVDCIWREIPVSFPFVVIDLYTIMPNHLHGIIFIKKQNNCEDLESYRGLKTGRGLINQTPTGHQTYSPNPISNEWIMMKNPATVLGKIIRFFKAKSVLKIRNKMNDSFCWQRNYYEHIIRDENELSGIREYIKLNPANWLVDEDNPVNGMRS